jgi:hypothetical protein
MMYKNRRNMEYPGLVRAIHALVSCNLATGPVHMKDVTDRVGLEYLPEELDAQAASDDLMAMGDSEFLEAVDGERPAPQHNPNTEAVLDWLFGRL